jgi:hypothetical protein
MTVTSTTGTTATGMSATASTGSDLAEAACAVMRPYLDGLMRKPQVQAVYLLSCGPGRPAPFDEFSDFDVAVVLDLPMTPDQWRPQRVDTYRLLVGQVPEWMPSFLFHVPVPWGRMEVNVHQMVFDHEADPRTRWNDDKCDAYLTKSQMLLDRGGRFAALITDKVAQARAGLPAEAERLANRLTWDLQDMPMRQALRLGPADGHHVLTHALEELIAWLYARAGQFLPNKKWRLQQLRARALVTTGQHQLLIDALRCDPTSQEDLQRRLVAVRALADSIDGLALDGAEAQAVRRRFQKRLEVSDQTLADLVSAGLAEPAASMVRDRVNFGLCALPSDVADAPSGGPYWALAHALPDSAPATRVANPAELSARPPSGQLPSAQSQAAPHQAASNHVTQPHDS